MGWYEDEQEQKAYERAQIWSAVLSLVAFVAIVVGFVMPWPTHSMWWMLSVAGGVFLMLAANPDW